MVVKMHDNAQLRVAGGLFRLILHSEQGLINQFRALLYFRLEIFELRSLWSA